MMTVTTTATIKFLTRIVGFLDFKNRNRSFTLLPGFIVTRPNTFGTHWRRQDESYE
jgi:hypothetical protein